MSQSEPMHEHVEAHPSPPLRTYLVIFFFLFIVTVAEVGIVFVPMSKALQASILILSAAAKAFLVAGWYMHLRWDWKPLWPVVLTPLSLVVLLILALTVRS